METVVWAVKNGDLDQVKEMLEDKVSKWGSGEKWVNF